MGGTSAPAINPGRIAPLIDEEALPGEMNHLFGDGVAQCFISPAGGEVGKTDVLFRSCSQKLLAIGVSGVACPMCRDALPVNNKHLWRWIPLLCKYMALCGDRNRLRSCSYHQQGGSRFRFFRFLRHSTLSVLKAFFYCACRDASCCGHNSSISNKVLS